MSTRNYSSQPRDLETQVIGMLGRPQGSVKKENARFLLQKISSTQNMVFQPRAAIFCLTLKLVLGGKAHALVRYGFGMLRGLYKDYQRSLTPKPSQNRRRSSERTQTVQSESPVFTDLGGVIQRTTKFHRKTVTTTRSHNASPRASLQLAKADSSDLVFNKRATLRVILKIFSKFFSKQFLKFRTNSYISTRKRSVLRSICRITLKGVGSAFGYLKAFRVRRGNLGKSSSLFSEDSRVRSPSFETRDKELWKRRHPIKNHSPSPSLIWRSSLANTSQNLSEPSSPKNPFIRKDIRRNTVEVLKKFDTFGTVGSEEFKQEESQSISKESEDNRLSGRKSTKGKDGVKDSQKPKKNLIGRHKATKLRASRPSAQNSRILENALDDIQKNHKAVKKAALAKLTACVNSDKKAQRINAAALLGDLIQYSLEKNRQGLMKSAVNDLKSIRSSVRPRPVELVSSEKSRPSESTSSQKSFESAKKPALGPKRQALRSGKPSRPSPKDLALEFVHKLDFINTSALKSKLIAFLNLIESNEPTAPKPEMKNAFRSIFRILEKKRFSKAYQAFHSIKRQANHKQQSQKLRIVKFSQKLGKILSSSAKSQKKSVFCNLIRSHAFPAGFSKLQKVFYKSRSRLSSILLLKAWFALTNYSKRTLLSHKFQQGKTQSWRTASPTVSLYSTVDSKRTLPLPKDIHDYIDDLYEVGQSNKAAKYLSPSSSIRTIKMNRNN